MRGLQAMIVHVLLIAASGMVALPVNVMAQATPQGAVELPSADAPYGLQSLTMPVTLATVDDLLDDMPANVCGESRVAQDLAADRIIVAYGVVDPQFGSPLVLSAISFSEGDFFPADFTAGAFVSMASQTDDYAATAFGRDGGLVWIQSETTVGVEGGKPGTPEASVVFSTLAWGETNSSLLFTAAATSPSGLDALVTAFVTVIENHR